MNHLFLQYQVRGCFYLSCLSKMDITLLVSETCRGTILQIGSGARARACVVPAPIENTCGMWCWGSLVGYGCCRDRHLNKNMQLWRACLKAHQPAPTCPIYCCPCLLPLTNQSWPELRPHHKLLTTFLSMAGFSRAATRPVPYLSLVIELQLIVHAGLRSC